MRSLMTAATHKYRNNWRSKVKINLDIQSNRVVNKVTGEQATVPAGVSYGTLDGKNTAVFTSSAIGGIQLAHNASFAPRTGDFTVEVLFDADGIWSEPADGSQIIPFCMWGSWGAAGQTMQMDFLYNHLTTGLQFGSYKPTGNSYFIKTGLPAMNLSSAQSVVNHVVFQRKAGVGYLYRNGALIHTAPYVTDLTGDIVSPFRIMSRRGGGDGSVWWRFIGKLIGFRLTHAAIYEGSSFTPPSSF